MSTAFPRTILPREATWPLAPTGLSSFGQSGKAQFRSTLQVGRVWTETWGNLLASGVGVRGFLAQVELFWHDQTILSLYAFSQKSLVTGSVSTGTPLIK
ncbi:MAG TPA: hypothetical protein VGI83_06875, partial [Gemmatimonadales bacterium]